LLILLALLMSECQQPGEVSTVGDGMSRRGTKESLYEEIGTRRPVAGEGVRRNSRNRKHMPPAGIRHLGLEGPPPPLVHILPPDQGGGHVAAPADIVLNGVPGARERPLQSPAERIPPPDHDVVAAKRTGRTRGVRILRAREREAEGQRPA